jgi:DNA processing protein
VREGARLVTDVDDVVEEMQDLLTGMRPAAEADRAPEQALSPDERAVMAQIEPEGTHVDALVRGCGLDAGKVNALVVGLQIKRLIRLLPGGLVSRRTGS